MSVAASISANESNLLQDVQWPENAEFENLLLLEDLPASITREQMIKILENFALLLSTVIPQGPPGPPGPQGNSGQCNCNKGVSNSLTSEEEDCPITKTLSKKVTSTTSKRHGAKGKSRIKPGKRTTGHKNKKKNGLPKGIDSSELQIVDVTKKLKKIIKKISPKKSYE